MMKEQILSALGSHPWAETLQWHNSTDSTNDRAKALAEAGAPHGTVVIAGHQTKGRGRMGRSFRSPEGMGIYLSVILRPDCKPRELMHLTCAVAVAMCEAVETVSGLRPGIKWINDLVAQNRKLGGILTELSFTGDKVRYAVVGIGINCHQAPEDFPEEIADIAISLDTATGKRADMAALAAEMTRQLYRMQESLWDPDRMARYRKDCVTLGKEIEIIQQQRRQRAVALDITEDGSLIARLPDGTTEEVATGEVSVRGLYSYC